MKGKIRNLDFSYSLDPLSIIAITVWTGGLATAAFGWAGFGLAVAGGSAAGYVSAETLKWVLIGAFSADVFYGVGQHFQALHRAYIDSWVAASVDAANGIMDSLHTLVELN
jgi:hypothetical protein